jgi:hypothetical protein
MKVLVEYYVNWRNEMSDRKVMQEAIEELQRVLSETVKQRDGWLHVLRRTADDLAYVAYNIDGSKLDDLPAGLVESTGASETALIAERNCREAIAAVRGVA